VEIKDKTVLITGSSSGIGQAIAIDCAKKKARILVQFRKNQKGAEETLCLVKKYSEGGIFQADLSKLSDVKKLFAAFGPIYPDLLVNNAGESIPGEMDDYELWEKAWKNVFMSQVYTTDEYLKNKKTDKGKIVNISSIYGLPLMGDVDYPHYSAAKAAVNSLTVLMAKRLAPKIQVNAIAPGWVWTRAWEGTTESEKKELAAMTKIKRFIKPEEIAKAVVMLLENDALTGEIIRIDGGLHLPAINSKDI